MAAWKIVFLNFFQHLITGFGQNKDVHEQASPLEEVAVHSTALLVD